MPQATNSRCCGIILTISINAGIVTWSVYFRSDWLQHIAFQSSQLCTIFECDQITLHLLNNHKKAALDNLIVRITLNKI